MDPKLVTTAFTLDGYRIVRTLGVVRGITVRSRSIVGNIGASLARSPRKATVVYFNPEYHEAVVTASPFVKVAEFLHHELGYYIYTNESRLSPTDSLQLHPAESPPPI